MISHSRRRFDSSSTTPSGEDHRTPIGSRSRWGHRGDVGDALYGSLWTVLGAGRTSSFLATRYCATGRALLTSTAKPTACTAGCELVLRNGNFHGTTASDFWRMDTVAFLAQNGFAATALWCFLTEPTFGTRATTVCGGLGRSAQARPRRGDIWCISWTTRGRSSFLFLRRATRLLQEQYKVLVAYKYT